MKLSFDEHEVVCMGQQQPLPWLQTEGLHVSRCHSGRDPGGAVSGLVCSVVIRKGNKSENYEEGNKGNELIFWCVCIVSSSPGPGLPIIRWVQ